MRPISERLASALASFEDGKRWVRGRLFSTYVDWPTRKRATEAREFCAIGALIKDAATHGEPIPADTSGYNNLTTFFAPFRQAFKTEAMHVIDTNDAAGSFQDVKAMFCAAIKQALADEAAQAVPDPWCRFDATTNTYVNILTGEHKHAHDHQ